jgi:putative transcriptional regulator
MSKNSTSKVVRYSRDKLPPDKADWARINAMTDDEVVAAALSDPDAQPLTPEQLARMRRVLRVKVLRQRLGMTQAEFAEAFHLPITTLRDWEQHRSTPDAPARALLLAIERDPEVMRRLLADRDQYVCRDAKAFMQTADHRDREPALSVQELGDPGARADDRFQVLRVRPCCSIRNLMASMGSGGSIG